MTRPTFARQAIKQRAGQRIVAVERRAIGAMTKREEIILPAYGRSGLCPMTAAEEIIPEAGSLADEIAYLLRDRPIRFPRQLFEGV